MAESGGTRIAGLLKQNEHALLEEWLAEQLAASSFRRDLMSESELRRESAEFLRVLAMGVEDAGPHFAAHEFEPVREMLASVSAERARKGFSPSETAIFVFSLRQPLFRMLQSALPEAGELADEIWVATLLLDAMGLYTIEVYQRSREEVIHRQQQELLELSTPVVKIWDKILALPLIGTLDSARTQIVMESLLERIVETEAEVAIIDITGVPTVDTLVAQHLIKTVAAARLMGADCIISGIRPQIAQTIVHLGINLEDTVTKATIADAIAVAMRTVGYAVVRAKPAG